MADIAIFRINYKSDFILTLNSDAGWMTPFCIKFWTGAPSQAYFAGYDGTNYTNCAPVDGEPTKLRVQFDDHHLPIGDLNFQIAYHFTVDDFPTSVEDEVINQASVIIEVDDAPAHVMLDLNGETAPEIQFSLPAYANEAQRIANEEERISNEEDRIAAEDTRQQNEQQRISREQQRINQEQQRVNAESERVSEFASLKTENEAATAAANSAATLANEKAEYADIQGDYAKTQGDYAKAQGDTAEEDHQRAEADHGIAMDDHQTAAADHQTAAADHTQAGNDHTRAESDHTRAESDHADVEVYVDSLGVFDLSKHNAVDGVLATYADISAALTALNALESKYKYGGMSIKFVQSSDNKYVQFRYMGTAVTGTPNPFLNTDNWQGVDDEPIAGSDNLVKSGGAYNAINPIVLTEQDVELSHHYLTGAGGVNDSENWNSYIFLNEGYSVIKAKLITNNTSFPVIGFYNGTPSASTYISGITKSGYSMSWVTASIPNGTTHIVICSRAASQSGEEFKVHTSLEDTIDSINSKIESINTDISNINGELNNINTEIDFKKELEVVDLTNQISTNDSVYVTPSPGNAISQSTYSGYGSLLVNVTQGEHYIITGQGGRTYRLWATVLNGDVVTRAASQVNETHEIVCDGTFNQIVFNVMRNHTYSLVKKVIEDIPINEEVADLDSDVQGLKTHIGFGNVAGIGCMGASLMASVSKHNSWVEQACTILGVTSYNKAKSGDGIPSYFAEKLWRGTYCTDEEFENIDILAIQFASQGDVYNTDSSHPLKATVADYEEGFDLQSETNPFLSYNHTQNLDYILKWWQKKCYAQRLNSNSKWYGTAYGKPCLFMFVTHWHDGRVEYNEAIRNIRNKWGGGLCEFDIKIGFQKNQPLEDGTQVSVIYAEDTQVIDNVTYGWHPKVQTAGAYIQKKMANIFADSLKEYFSML